MRYYYKSKDGKGLMNLKSPLADDNYIEITAEEFEALQPKPQEPSAEQTAILEKQHRIAELKALLESYDYKTSKYVDGDYTDEEWAAIVAQRKAWRSEINMIEEELLNN